MLKGIPEIIGSDLLKALADMGHGDILVIADHFLSAVFKITKCSKHSGKRQHSTGNDRCNLKTYAAGYRILRNTIRVHGSGC